MFVGIVCDIIEENFQVCCCGVVLMVLLNKCCSIVLIIGNKSEMVVGYVILYGDMVGGFDVLKDVFKMLVFKLFEYCNIVLYVILQWVIICLLLVELVFDQKDEDSLLFYDILDVIFEGYVE